MGLLSIDQIPPSELRGKTVLVRVDLSSQWAEDTGLHDALRTFTHLADGGAQVIIAFHNGPYAQPQGKPIPFDGIAKRLAALLGRVLIRLNGWESTEIMYATSHLSDRELLVLESLSAHPGEEANDAGLAELLSRLCDIYCNDAFALAHELRASTVGVARRAKRPVAGVAFERELGMLALTLDAQRRPLLAILGGELAKEKLRLMEDLPRRVNSLLLGGELVLPFLIAQGRSAGRAQVTDEMISLADHILREAKANKCAVRVPLDFIAVEATELAQMMHGERLPDGPRILNIAEKELRDDQVICDIGERTRWAWGEHLAPAGTIFWHGPLGVCELEPFRDGTKFLAEAFISRTWPGVHRGVMCGSRLVTSLRQMGIATERIRHLTPAGRAALHYFAGRPLPAADVLSQEGETKREPLRILIPLNGSDNDTRALHAAAEMAARDAELFLLHVRSGPDEERYPDLMAALSEAERLKRRMESEHIFARANAILAARGIISAGQVAAQGEPAEIILRCARRISAGSIVLAADRAGERAGAQRVIDHATCAVLVARPSTATERAKAPSRL